MKLTEQRLIEIIKEEIEAISAAPMVKTTSDIISTLSTLYDSLTEELEEIEEGILEGGEGPSKAIQWIWWGPKARKSQAKVNKIKLNIVALEFARDNAEDSDVKDKLKLKVVTAKEQANTLQQMINDKFSGKGDITKRSLASEKIKGQLQAIKKTTGMTDNPNKSKELKDQLKELGTRLRKEEEAINALKPSTEEREEAAADIKKKKKESKEKNTEESNSTEGYDDVLSETKYQSQSIRDRFSRLL
jgi:hypothetical protein